MDLARAAGLGLLQGLTEFLPVSSSAHLVLAPYFFHWTDPGLAYDVALHLGTLAAVLVFFWRDWLGIARGVWAGGGGASGLRLSTLLVATVPAAAAGLLFEDQAERALRDPRLIAATLSAFALALWFYDRRGTRAREVESITLIDALIVGGAQALAIIPGVSRSGVTITAALALGMSRTSAARLSFLMSAPIIAGAGLLKAKPIVMALMAGGAPAQAIVIGFLSSLVSGFAAIAALSALVRTRTFAPFVGYRLCLGLVIVVVVVLRD